MSSALIAMSNSGDNKKTGTDSDSHEVVIVLCDEKDCDEAPGLRSL